MDTYVQVILDIPLSGVFTYKNNPDSPAETGKRVEIMFGNRKMQGFVVKTSQNNDDAPLLDDSKIKTIRRTIDKETIFDSEHIQLAAWIADYYLCSQGEALSAMIPSGRRESTSTVFEDNADILDSSKAKELSDEQQNALTAITADAASPTPGMHYLYGLTGTGKTEVFLQVAEHIIAQKKTVIYLVPEISLTHQLAQTVSSRFKNRAAILHSGLTPSQRLAEWMRIRRGDADIIIGARSAVFAPAPNIGLIIIDEEHDGSYKSGTTPRYNARQVAIKRCKDHHAVLLMGSATPSVETWFLMNSGDIQKHVLTYRLAGGARPIIRTVPLKGCTTAITPELAEAVNRAKHDGRQSILFLNRRGFSRHYQCKTCGSVLTCRQCSVALTYHKKKNRMICHYCGWSIEPPKACPECGSLDAGYNGFGTEYIEEEIQKTFPDCTIARADTDSITGKDQLKNMLEDFRAGKTDILLGTQMVAKGLNFPGVRVVGVIQADTGLNMPDFRAAERTFSLLVQVAGRAGRFFPDGEVIVQTYAPENPAISLACTTNMEEFYHNELQQRDAMDFPPYRRLIRMVFRAKEPAKAEAAAQGAADIINTLIPTEKKDVEILGPSECPLAMISGNARWQIILRAKKMRDIHTVCHAFLHGYKAPFGVYIETDVDPVSLL